uniref:Uncharacterized protein n=1 Tax=Anopheles stephensi TaxID=30069 RepID=A0A182YSN6_ANOST
MNENSFPGEGWTRQKCWIKRTQLSYANAESAITIMSGESSTDPEQAPTVSSAGKLASYADIFSERVVENSMKPIHVKSGVEYAFPRTPSPPTMSLINEYSEPNHPITKVTEQCNCKTIQALIEAQTNIIKEFRAEQKRDYERILKEQKKIINRLGIIEVQMNSLLNHTEIGTTDTANTEHPFIKTVEDLQIFEKDLAEEEYFTRMSDILKHSVNDKDINNRIAHGPEFQNQEPKLQ